MHVLIWTDSQEVKLTNLAASVPHVLRVVVGGLQALTGRVNPAQLPVVMPYKKLP